MRKAKLRKVGHYFITGYIVKPFKMTVNHWLSLKRGFGGCGHGFGGCEGLDGFDRLGGCDIIDGLDGLSGFDGLGGFDGFSGFNGFSEFGGFDGSVESTDSLDHLKMVSQFH